MTDPKPERVPPRSSSLTRPPRLEVDQPARSFAARFLLAKLARPLRVDYLEEKELFKGVCFRNHPRFRTSCSVNRGRCTARHPGLPDFLLRWGARKGQESTGHSRPVRSGSPLRTAFAADAGRARLRRTVAVADAEGEPAANRVRAALEPRIDCGAVGVANEEAAVELGLATRVLATRRAGAEPHR